MKSLPSPKLSSMQHIAVCRQGRNLMFVDGENLIMEFHYNFSCSGSTLLKMPKGLNLRSQAVPILKNVDILQIKLQIIANKNPVQGN